MRQPTWYLLCILGLAALSLASPVVKREALEDNDTLNPAEQDLSDLDDENRDKRKIEGAVEVKFGAKNAILGFIFNPIDPNIPIAYGIGTGAALPRGIIGYPQGQYQHSPPAPGPVPHGHVPQPFYPEGPQQAHVPQGYAPEGYHVPQHVTPQGYFPDQGHLPNHGVAAKRALETKKEEDAVHFEPGQKVSLEVPDQLFGSGFSLVTDLSKAAGNFIQNTAERQAQFWEAMKPFLQVLFGVNSIKITRDVPANNSV